MADEDYSSYDEITDRLDEIAKIVRSKNTPLEASLDLFDEALRLGSRAIDMVDSSDLSPRERAELQKEAESKLIAAQEADGDELARRLLARDAEAELARERTQRDG